MVETIFTSVGKVLNKDQNNKQRDIEQNAKNKRIEEQYKNEEHFIYIMMYLQGKKEIKWYSFKQS